VTTQLPKIFPVPTESDDAAPETKVRSIPELAYLAASERAAGQRIALCHGVFDLLHMGHVRHLQQARSKADRLAPRQH
jgi:bifunctional ADP-heptose synthase (sugar kinase/adenylyltransferase)